MQYFDDEKHVEEYIKMADGYDGAELIELLKKHLSKGSSVLEIGSGPGVDLKILSENYNVTGSDNSQGFVNYIKKTLPNARAIILNAVSIETSETFDSIFSNKVLQHLTVDELRQSFKRQASVVNPGGIIMHSFWRGEGTENFDGLHFQYYQPDELKTIAEKYFEVIDIQTYTEMDENDSIYCILKNQKQ